MQMKNFSTLAKTNIIIILILTIGFALLFTIYYHTFHKNAMDELEHSAAENISRLYSDLSEFFIQPISISATMAKDGFLISYLSSDASYKSKNFEETITKYLQGYNKIYDFDGVFLCTVKNNAHFTQDGYITSLETEKIIHNWYKRLLDSDEEFEINIDFDTTPSAKFNASLFINHKIFDRNDELLGITGICVHLDSILNKIFVFERETGNSVHIISEDGIVQLSSHSTALSNLNFFEIESNRTVAELVQRVKNLWTRNSNDKMTTINIDSQNFTTIKYIPSLSWYIVLESYMGDFYDKMRTDLFKSGIIVLSIMLSIILFISKVIYDFEHKIEQILGDRLRYFHEATRFMYSNIYEIDLTRDMFAPESRLHQFTHVRTKDELPYSQSVRLLSERIVKDTMQEKFLNLFSRDNLLQEYANGHDHISLDCEVLIDNVCQWLRYDAHMFTVDADHSVHMYIYSKNISEERQKEILAQTDALTQCLTRGVVEEVITKRLQSCGDKRYAFFIIDIDNFKTANDTYGHMFGDACIKSFCQKIKDVFRKDDIIGRLGGDEFVVFVPFQSEEWVHKKAFQLVKMLDHNCVQENMSMHLSGSVGISLSPQDGTTLEQLYHHADVALYEAKSAGKNSFYFYNMEYIYFPFMNE